MLFVNTDELSAEFQKGWTLIQRQFQEATKRFESATLCRHLDARDFSQLYFTIYNLFQLRTVEGGDCKSLLYYSFSEAFKDYSTTTVLPALRGKRDELLLREYLRRWENHKILVFMFLGTFEHLDRSPAVPNVVIPDRKVGGLGSFRNKIYPEMKDDIKKTVFSLINRERDEQRVDRILVKKVIYTFLEINSVRAYQQDFQSPMLADAVAYYSAKAASWIEESSWQQYLRKARESLKREKERAAYYLDADSQKKLLQCVVQEVLQKFADTFWNQSINHDQSGYRAMLRGQKVENLVTLYMYFFRSPEGLQAMAAIFQKQVIEEGEILVEEDAATSSKEVWKLINLHDKFLNYVKKCFFNDLIFLKAFKEGFEYLFRKGFGECSTAEFLARFCDRVLNRDESPELGDEAIKDALEKAVTLVSYTYDKDLFAESYRNKLARRLLINKNFNAAIEGNTVSKIKKICGMELGAKVEGMINDLSTARETQSLFEEYLGKQTVQPEVGLSVTVLNSSFWPTFRNPDIVLPDQMAESLEVFEDFYRRNTDKKRLTWMLSLGTCTIQYNHKYIALTLSVFQAAVLLLFNFANTLSYASIKRLLNTKDEDLVGVLHSLSCPTYKILRKIPDTNTVTPADHFSLNKEFQSTLKHIEIPLPPMDEDKKVPQNVNTDRCCAVDACIMRAFKSTKVLPYQQLVLECMEQLSSIFKPEPRFIKERLEVLMKQDFLKRDDDDPNIFHYVL